MQDFSIKAILLVLTVCLIGQVKAKPQVTFLDEYVIETGKVFQNTTVGGLSSIDYANGYFYLISDHGGGKQSHILGEPRYYQVNIKIVADRFVDIEFLSVGNLLPKRFSNKGIDPESLRVIAPGNRYIWSSEGSIKDGIGPNLYVNPLAQTPEHLSSTYTLPSYFRPSHDAGPRNNASFEGLTESFDQKGIWVAMEGPLKQDSDEASLDSGAWLRFSYFSFATKRIERQFVYYLDPLPFEPEAKPSAFRTTGVVELLQLPDQRFLVLERAYTSGLPTGGNQVKLFLVDAKSASDTKDIVALQSGQFQPANKQLLLDLSTVKDKIPSKRIDNLEGLTFGPLLPSGNRSLLMVSDDNFNAFGPQISQILLFEIGGI